MAFRSDDSGQDSNGAERNVKKVLDILLAISDYQDRNAWAGRFESYGSLVVFWKGGVASLKDLLTMGIAHLLLNENLRQYEEVHS